VKGSAMDLKLHSYRRLRRRGASGMIQTEGIRRVRGEPKLSGSKPGNARRDAPRMEADRVLIAEGRHTTQMAASAPNDLQFLDSSK